MTAGVSLMWRSWPNRYWCSPHRREVAYSSGEGRTRRGPRTALELKLRALGERFSRLGDENRACGFDVSDEACALTADNEKCFYI